MFCGGIPARATVDEIRAVIEMYGKVGGAGFPIQDIIGHVGTSCAVYFLVDRAHSLDTSVEIFVQCFGSTKIALVLHL